MLISKRHYFKRIITQNIGLWNTMLTNLIWNNFISCIFTTLIMKMRTYSCVYTFTEGVVWASEATFNSDIIKIHRKQYFMVAWKVVFVFYHKYFFSFLVVCASDFTKRCVTLVFGQNPYSTWVIVTCFLTFQCILFAFGFVQHSPHILSTKNPPKIFSKNTTLRVNMLKLYQAIG